MAREVITNKTSREIKKAVAGVRTHFDVFEHAREIYLAQIKRAEADYYDRIRRATSILAGENDASAPEAPVASPTNHQPASA